MDKRFDGKYTYCTLYDFGGYGPCIRRKSTRYVFYNDWLATEIKQYFLLKIPGYRPPILYGINCARMR